MRLLRSAIGTVKPGKVQNIRPEIGSGLNIANFAPRTKRMEMDNERKTASYAVVTGAASGMGRLYAQKLARKGYNLIMVDIAAGKLEEAAEEIRCEMEQQMNGRPAAGAVPDIRTFVCDLSAQGAAAHVAQAAGGCDVEVLVNNAGIMYCQTICNTSRKSLSLMMMLHTYTPLMLCREFVPGMIARGKGYVLNVSSLAAWMDWPAIGMYGNTKRFVKGFSRSLRVECMGTGVSVTNAYFGAVDTPLIPLKPSLRRLARHLGVMISADKATDRALSALFHRRKGTIPGLLNWIFLPVVVCLPDRVLSWALRKPGRHLLMDV